MMNQQQIDEFNVLHSIYDTDFTPPQSIHSTELPVHIQYTGDNIQAHTNLNVITINVHHDPLIYIKYYVPYNYPAQQLYYTIIYNNQDSNSIIDLFDEHVNTNVLLNIDRQHIIQLVNDIQSNIVHGVQIYDITECIKQYLTTIDIHRNHHNVAVESAKPAVSSSRRLSAPYASSPAKTKHYSIYTGDAITEKRSTFQAHCCTITNMNDIQCILDQLYANNKIKRATHNMYAYIIQQSDNTELSDCNDDGESGSGRVLLELLYKLHCYNTIIIVSRWYGGIHLGSTRFTLISSVANTVLQQYMNNKSNDIW